MQEKTPSRSRSMPKRVGTVPIRQKAGALRRVFRPSGHVINRKKVCDRTGGDALKSRKKQPPPARHPQPLQRYCFEGAPSEIRFQRDYAVAEDEKIPVAFDQSVGSFLAASASQRFGRPRRRAPHMGPSHARDIRCPSVGSLPVSTAGRAGLVTPATTATHAARPLLIVCSALRGATLPAYTKRVSKPAIEQVVPRVPLLG